MRQRLTFHKNIIYLHLYYKNIAFKSPLYLRELIWCTVGILDVISLELRTVQCGDILRNGSYLMPEFYDVF